MHQRVLLTGCGRPSECNCNYFTYFNYFT